MSLSLAMSTREFEKMYVMNALNEAGDLVAHETAFTLSGAYVHADAYKETHNVEIYLNGALIADIPVKGNVWGYGVEAHKRLAPVACKYVFNGCLHPQFCEFQCNGNPL
jgi:hypothetical protein